MNEWTMRVAFDGGVDGEIIKLYYTVTLTQTHAHLGIVCYTLSIAID